MEKLMKRPIFYFVVLIMGIISVSCGDLFEEPEYTKITIINETNEDVTIYYIYTLLGRFELTTLYKNDFPRLIEVQKGKTYYAEGKDSEKSYGSKTIYSLNYDVWHIN
jgi:hypothetical protein